MKPPKNLKLYKTKILGYFCKRKYETIKEAIEWYIGESEFSFHKSLEETERDIKKDRVDKIIGQSEKPCIYEVIIKRVR